MQRIRIAVSTWVALIVAAASLVTLTAFAKQMPSGIVQDVDVKVTRDNNNVDAGSATPGSDGRNLVQNETTVAINPVNPNMIAVACNDTRLLSDGAPIIWLGLNVSADGGKTWHNTFPPGFLTDASPEGLASPLKGLPLTSDPCVRFDADGNLYLSGVAFSGLFIPDQPGGIDNVDFLVKYNYTPGTPGGESTATSAGNPPNCTYAFTTIVDRGSSGSRKAPSGSSSISPG